LAQEEEKKPIIDSQSQTTTKVDSLNSSKPKSETSTPQINRTSSIATGVNQSNASM
jgi:hypothetical protein